MLHKQLTLVRHFFINIINKNTITRDQHGLPHYCLYGSFHLRPWKLPPTSTEVNQLPWKLPSTSSIEVMLFQWNFPWKLLQPTSTEVNQLAWILPPISMGTNLLPFTPMEVAIEVAMEGASFSSFIYLHGSFFYLQLLSRKHLPTFMEVRSRPASMEMALA